MTPPLWQKGKRTKQPLDEGETVGLKLNIQKPKIMASGPITSRQIDGGDKGNSDRLYIFRLQNHCR